MCNTEKICSIADLSNKLKELGEPKEGYTRFFRGHSDESYILVPSIYRSNLIGSEDKIIKEAFTRCSSSFLPYETLFEKLTKLQHYDYKTRLLDISSNVLVALYFSIAEHKKQSVANADKDGEIIILDIPNSEIKYSDSDLVSILSNLSLMKKDFNIKKCEDEARLYAICEKVMYESEMEDKRQSLIKAGKSIPETYTKFLEIGKKSIEDKSFIEKFNQQPEVIELLNYTRREKPSFSPNIEPEKLHKIVAVKAKENNPRIMRQQGAFLLFGINEEKAKHVEVNPDWIRKINDKDKLLVDKDFKDKILKELKSFGISHQELFPELDSQANDIMDKYK
ncbi:FRG domain-containing protein [Rodentibacter haemolyticus]|uniref:FRG domain-containing protein n=1 Tax=Rodentibacter haemolyticus TaxID=2778911 RepID=A0ABX6UWM8_9PAST|nr:FRG domain-containing protein [Rodentibacter haemolyticus]QPB41591.1 FRG domain-containing protein [Rodentibacter haemolyticus]